MKFILLSHLLPLFSTIALATAIANPTDGHNGQGNCHRRGGCLSDHDARKIVERWTSLFEWQIDLVDQTVTDDISIEEETVNFFFNIPPGPYVAGKEPFRGTLEFGKAQNGTTNRKIEPLIIVHDCDTISFRWQATEEATGLDPTSTAKAGDLIAYKGIDILEIEKGTKLVKTAYSSSDWIPRLYQAGIKICFQRDAPQPVCSA